MTHFSVLVIGDDVSGQLAPYDENLESIPYKDEAWNHAEEIQRAREYYLVSAPEAEPEVDRSSDIAMLLAFHSGEDIRGANSPRGVTTRWTTYNPSGQWDWWITGGRFKGGFKLKEQAASSDFEPVEIASWSLRPESASDYLGRADRARVRAIDWEALRAERREQAAQAWEALQEATEGIAPPEVGYAQEKAQAQAQGLADAGEWVDHPWHRAALNAGFWNAYDHFLPTLPQAKESYLWRCEQLLAPNFYAVVCEGQWHARGEMGWFGTSADDLDATQWASFVAEMLHGLPGDTWLTVVDCHV